MYIDIFSSTKEDRHLSCRLLPVPGSPPLTMIKIKKCRCTRGGRKEPLTFKRKTYPGSSDEWVTGREFYYQKWTLMIFSSSWNFPELDWLFVREAVFSFFAKCGEGEKTEAGNWKQLYQTAGGIWNTSPILVNVVPGIFQSVLGFGTKLGRVLGPIWWERHVSVSV